MAGIFKPYDIRGVYGDTLTEPLARDIGRAFVTFLGCRRVVVGQDMRPHSEPLVRALVAGLTEQGADAICLGLCSTPMSYFANNHFGADASIMVTASHNPGRWNGFKLCRAAAVPISGDTGIADIERIVRERAFAPPAARRGEESAADIAGAYRAHVARHARLERPMRIAVDFANGAGILEYRAIEDLLPAERLFDTLDGTFPNHEANPLEVHTLEALQARVREGGFDFGAAFDGDADRVGFVDETGAVIPMDLSTALLAQELLATRKGIVLYDLRSSHATPEAIAEAGGTPVMSRVGHSFIKAQMRACDALFAGELSGHYYFRDSGFTESAALAILLLANRVSRAEAPLSELVRPLRRYAASGEINSRVVDAAAVFARVRERYGDGRLLELDGLTVEYADWWFNVRASNTEPYVRLNLEARTRAAMEARRDELLAVIRG